MKFAAYPKYKPSRVAYLSRAPETWEAMRLKFTSRLPIKNGIGAAADTDDPDLPRYVRITDIESAKSLRTDTFRSLPVELASTASFSVGDILFACVGATFGKTYFHCSDVGPVCYAGYLARYTPRVGVDPRFISYWSESAPYRAQLDANVIQSTIQNFSAAKFRDLELVLPPQSEQQAIADFLDRETAMLGELVEKKRKLIEKLNEKRIALISRTVSRGLLAEAAAKAGLNPHPKLKPSGIEWLGDIPEHWELLQLRRRITLQRGVDITKDEQNEGNVPVVSSGGISSHHDRALVRGPGVIVGRKGTAGAVYYIEKDFWPHDTTLYVREYRASNPRYVYYKLLSMNLQNYDTGSANPTVNRNIVHPEIVSWPSPTEQRAVVEYLDRETAKIDKMMEQVEAAREKLEEYRTALITAAVTGKIDVRAVDR